MDDEIFAGKTLPELMRDVCETVLSKRKEINDLTSLLTGYATDVDSALSVLPLVKDFVDVSIKNDKQLLDLAVLAAKTTHTTTEIQPKTVEMGSQLEDMAKIRQESKKAIEQLRIDRDEINESLDEYKEAVKSVSPVN